MLFFRFIQCTEQLLYQNKQLNDVFLAEGILIVRNLRAMHVLQSSVVNKNLINKNPMTNTLVLFSFAIAQVTG